MIRLKTLLVNETFHRYSKTGIRSEWTHKKPYNPQQQAVDFKCRQALLLWTVIQRNSYQSNRSHPVSCPGVRPLRQLNKSHVSNHVTHLIYQPPYWPSCPGRLVLTAKFICFRFHGNFCVGCFKWTRASWHKVGWLPSRNPLTRLSCPWQPVTWWSRRWVYYPPGALR